MTNFANWCRFLFVMEVWIYVLYLEFRPGAEIGTLQQTFIGGGHPQEVVSSLRTGRLKNALAEGQNPFPKNPLDRIRSPATI